MSTDVSPVVAGEAVDFDPFAGNAIARVVATTAPQREIWLADRLGTEASLAYNESITLRLHGPLQRDAFVAAVQAVIDAHESLRATISADGQQMLIAESSPIEIATHDLSQFAGAERDQQLADVRDRAVRTPFQLDTGPLVRAELFVVSANEHALVFTAHHIVCDGWSFGVIVRDLAAFYAARLCGTAAPGAGDSFAEYAADELAHEGSESHRIDEQFWISRFQGPTPTLDLPTDRPRRPWRTFASRRIDVPVDADFTQQIRRWGARQGASLTATLTTAFALLMHRLSGSTSIVVGMPAAGQSVSGRERLVGHCVNLLPLRFEIDPAMSPAELVSQGRTMVLDAFEHQRYTFGSLLARLTLPRDAGRLPLVSVLFNVDQALDPSTIQFPQLTFEFSGNPRAAENFELFVNAVPTGAGLRLEVQYNSDLFDDDAIRRWMDAYLTSLRKLVDAAVARIGDIDILSPAARAQLASLQPVRSEYDRSVLMHQFVERQVDRTPERTALVFGEQSLSYAELDARANRIAHALRAMGVRRGVNVGLCVDRSADMVAAILGILKAGGAHVPLDPAFPAERLSYMIEDASLGVLITQDSHVARAGVESARALLLDVDQRNIDGYPAERIPVDALSATADSPAYIIYTSGSTGRPKGVQVPHAGVANLFPSLAREPGITAADTLVAITTISFDIAIVELILPLTVGARVVIASRDEVRDAGALRRLLESSDATVMQATPAGWRILLESGWNGRTGFKAISGGEPLAPDLAAQLLQRCGSVWNGYGPTETTVYSTFWRVEQPEHGISIGRPVANTTVWILDERQQPCPIGVPGEICIGGDGVTLGYLDRPELTGERFLPNNFDACGGRIYRTGDRGRWLARGLLEHLGRLDFQVKIRGYRVELGEIEANLLAFPGVTRAVAMAREDRPGDVRLVAYVVAERNASEGALREHLQKILPEYFVPQHFVLLPAIPLLPNGKVDRKALPAPEMPANSLEYIAPRNDIERGITTIMEQVLGLPGIGVHDDFFALGGHSLLAAQLTARINREFQVRLSLRTLFDAPTIEKLARAVGEQQNSGTAPQHTPIVRQEEQRKAPLSIMQERLWMLEQLHPGRVVYNTPSAHRLRGALDLSAFTRAFAAMVRHQPSLRTSIAVEDGAAMQRIHDDVPLDLTPVDLSDLHDAERETVLRQHLEALTNEPFDLTQAPLFRAKLYRLTPQEHVLLFVPHHIIWDGWSFDLLYAELASAYDAFRTGAPDPLKPLPVSYGDFAVWHREWLRGDEFAKQIGYWRERLASISALAELPADKPRRPGMSGEGRTEWLTVDKQTTESLRELSRRADTTLFMTLLSLYYVVLHRVSGQQHLVVGTPVRGRNLTEVEQVMGYFTNLLPLHLELRSTESFSDLLKRVKATVLDSFAHPDVPLEMLMRELTVQRGEGGSLLYQARFSFQDARHRVSKWGGLSHEQILLFQRGATEDLGLWFLDNDHGMVGGVTYNADIITAESAQLLRDRYMALVNAVLKAPDTPIGDLAIALESDPRQIAAWNDTATHFGGPTLLHEVFATTAARAPEQLAIVGAAGSASYQRIDEIANRIAHTLRARNVPVGAVVGLCEDAGERFLAGLLGILKAGCTCLPIDPAVAATRRRNCLQASSAAAFVGDARFADCTSGLVLEQLWLDSAELEISAAPGTPLTDGKVDANSPAVLIDLAGVQPQPRFVTLSHGTITNALRAMANSLTLVSSDRWLVSSAPCAEACVLEWLMASVTGATAVMVSSPAPDGNRWRAQLEQNNVTIAHLPSDAWAALLSTGWRPAAGLRGLVSGERPSLELAEQLTTTAGRFWRVWGRAETGVWTTLACLESAEDALTVGAPAANIQVRVIEHARDAPVNVWGSLRVRAANAAWFDTGETARWRPDGRIELANRADGVVYVRGCRIELPALTAWLRSQPASGDAVCVVRKAEDHQLRLAAYVVSNTETVAAEIEVALREWVPPIIPVDIVLLAQLPRLSDGRIDVRLLPAPATPTSNTVQDTFVEPQTGTEQALARIWCELLGLTRVSARDNFFDLGGHSLLAIQAIGQMERLTGRQIPARRYMFQNLAQLAASYDEPAAEPPKKSIVNRLLGAFRTGR